MQGDAERDAADKRKNIELLENLVLNRKRSLNMHRLKKHLPDILLTILAALLFAGVVLATIVLAPRAIDHLEARHAAVNDIYNGQ